MGLTFKWCVVAFLILLHGKLLRLLSSSRRASLSAHSSREPHPCTLPQEHQCCCRLALISSSLIALLFLRVLYFKQQVHTAASSPLLPLKVNAVDKVDLSFCFSSSQGSPYLLGRSILHLERSFFQQRSASNPLKNEVIWLFEITWLWNKALFCDCCCIIGLVIAWDLVN